MKIQTVYILCGLPGSGKSTWAHRKANEIIDGETAKVIVINRDSIRTMLKGKYFFNKEYEPIVKEIRNLIIKRNLEVGKFDLIVDETHLTKEKRKESIDVVLKHDCCDIDITIVYFTESENNLEYRMKNAKGVSVKQWSKIINDMKEIFEAPIKNELPELTGAIQIVDKI